MPRAVAFSHRQKKIQLQNKRALKRGEEPEHAPVSSRRSHPNRGRTDLHKGSGVRGLESRFIALSPDYAETTRLLTYETPLTRPLPPDAAVFPFEVVTRPEGAGLSVPARPEFRYGQTKREVEAHEEEVFREWMSATRSIVDDWVESKDEGCAWPHSPSMFETNLEVWRQLWRVTESSSIILLLVDSRAPPLHCPPSLRSYIRGLRPRKQVILVLTKTDLVDPAAVEGWRTWLTEWWREDTDADQDNDVQVVSMTAYDTQLMYGESRRQHRAAMPVASRGELVAALKTAHERLLKPPRSVESDPAKLVEWTPPVRSTVDWEALAARPEAVQTSPRRLHGGRVKHPTGDVGDSPAEKSEDDNESDDDNKESDHDDYDHERDPETEPLGVSLVGQPNVGKSSLLNALLGASRVRTSKTPGKTKHFQTILTAGRTIKIIDCPGLVCPSLVPMEFQAMSGILPISQIPSLPACIHFSATVAPLETIFRVPIKLEVEDDMEAKKTWRGNAPRPVKTERPLTTGDIMDSRAFDRGYITAKSGWPDANRAGNAMLRALADGRVRWGFRPPGCNAIEGVGVWLGGNPLDEAEAEAEAAAAARSAESAEEHEGEEDGSQSPEEEQDGSIEDESDEDPDSFTAANKRSFFEALSLDSADSEDDEDDLYA